jgi:hypothetical protein
MTTDFSRAEPQLESRPCPTPPTSPALSRVSRAFPKTKRFARERGRRGKLRRIKSQREARWSFVSIEQIIFILADESRGLLNDYDDGNNGVVSFTNGFCKSLAYRVPFRALGWIDRADSDIVAAVWLMEMSEYPRQLFSLSLSLSHCPLGNLAWRAQRRTDVRLLQHGRGSEIFRGFRNVCFTAHLKRAAFLEASWSSRRSLRRRRDA